MNYLYLLKYKIKNNYETIINKIKIVFLVFLLIVMIPSFIIINPFSKLKNILENKKNNINKYAAVKTSSISGITLPLNGVITSNYGYRNDPISGKYSKHTGIDISGIHHDNVRSIDDGIVTFAGSQNGYGYCIEIKHKNYYSFYAHLSKIKVKQNSVINKGDIIGIEGGDPYSDPNPGYSTGHHLNFEIRKDSEYSKDINPRNYINQKI